MGCRRLHPANGPAFRRPPRRRARLRRRSSRPSPKHLRRHGCRHPRAARPRSPPLLLRDRRLVPSPPRRLPALRRRLISKPWSFRCHQLSRTVLPFRLRSLPARKSHRSPPPSPDRMMRRYGRGCLPFWPRLVRASGIGAVVRRWRAMPRRPRPKRRRPHRVPRRLCRSANRRSHRLHHPHRVPMRPAPRLCRRRSSPGPPPNGALWLR